MNQQAKVPRETEKDQVDKLITFYEQNRPNAGRTIDVNIPRKKLRKFIEHEVDEDHFRYRNRVLHCIFPKSQEPAR